MTEQETPESPLFEKKKGNWLSRLLKIFFILAALLLIGITILANMGGSSDTMKESLERFVTDIAGGRETRIGNFIDMNFFPKIGVTAEDIHILSNTKSQYPVVKIGKLQVYMPFWHVAMRDPRFSLFYIEDVEAIKGVLGAQSFRIEKAYVDHDRVAETAHLVARGQVGVHEWDMTVGLEVNGSHGKYTYRLQKGFLVDIALADLKISAVVTNHEAGYFKVNDLSVILDDIKFGGDVILSSVGDKMLSLQGTLYADEMENALQLDWVVDRSQPVTKISGDITGGDINYNSFFGENSVASIISRFRDIMGYDLIQDDPQTNFLGPADLDLFFDLENLVFSEQDAMPLSFYLVQDDGRIRGSSFSSRGMLLTPSFVLVEGEGAHDWNMIVHDGNLDTPFLSHWLAGFKNIPDLSLDCGWGKIEETKDRVILQSFNAQTDQGMLSLKEEDVALGDQVFVLKQNKDGLQELSLTQEPYNFVQTSLQKSASGSACAPYIALSEEKKNIEAGAAP